MAQSNSTQRKTCNIAVRAAFAVGASLTVAACGTTGNFPRPAAPLTGEANQNMRDTQPDVIAGLIQQNEGFYSNAGLPQGVSRIRYNGYEAGSSVLVDIANHKLYYIEGQTAIVYPIASPRDGASIPPAVNTVTRKAVNPTWTPTANMRAKNPNLPVSVPGGPNNPLGVRALYLGETLYRIHGTNAPDSIGTDASSGCIRMYNNHVIDLYERVPVGAKVMVYTGGHVPGVAPQRYMQANPS